MYGAKLRELRSVTSDTWPLDHAALPHKLREQPFVHSPLVRLPKIEKFVADHFGVKQDVYAKIELNDTSTFKDRAAERQIIAAKHAGYGTVVAASSGNFAEALAFYAHKHDLSLILYMPSENVSEKALHRLTKVCGSEVRLVDGGGYDAALKQSNQFAHKNRDAVYNANPGVVWGPEENQIDNRAIQLSANAEIAREIALQLRDLGIDRPGLVACPAGNGTLAAALCRGFRESGLNPRLLVATCENPLIRAAMRNWRSCPDLEHPLKVTYLTEAGAGACAVDGEIALDAVRTSGGAVVEVDGPSIERAMNLIDEAIQEATHCFSRKPLRVLPFAAAGLAGMLKNRGVVEHIKSNTRRGIQGPIVLLITGVEDGGD